MKKRLVGLMLVGVMVLAGGTVVSADDSKTIAIVPWDMSQAFAAQFAKVAADGIEEKRWKAVTMDPKGDWTTEFTIIENLITQKVDGIIYTAIDADGANDAVAMCREAGIPIVGYDCLASEGGEDAAVRYDDYKGGEMVAEQVMEALGDKENAQIIIYEEEPSIASSSLRIKGFREYLAENHPKVEIVGNRSADRTADGCYTWATDMVTTYPDADAFFCWWNECTMAAYNALQDAGKTDIYVVGYDAMKEQQDLMNSVGEDCKLYASPGMSAAKMADKCVEFMGQIFDGSYTRSGADDIYQMTPELLTVHNAKDFDIDK